MEFEIVKYGILIPKFHRIHSSYIGKIGNFLLEFGIVNYGFFFYILISLTIYRRLISIRFILLFSVLTKIVGIYYSDFASTLLCYNRGSSIGHYIGHFQHFQYITDNICWITFLIHAMNEACPYLHLIFFIGVKNFVLKLNTKFLKLLKLWTFLGTTGVTLERRLSHVRQSHYSQKEKSKNYDKNQQYRAITCLCHI